MQDTGQSYDSREHWTKLDIAWRRTAIRQTKDSSTGKATSLELGFGVLASGESYLSFSIDLNCLSTIPLEISLTKFNAPRLSVSSVLERGSENPLMTLRLAFFCIGFI